MGCHKLKSIGIGGLFLFATDVGSKVNCDCRKIDSYFLS